MMLKIAVTGCQGRMGQRIACLARKSQQFQLTALLERPGHPQLGEGVHGLSVVDDLREMTKADVLIDFTAPEPTLRNVAFCREHKVKMVIGTTGLTAAQTLKIQEAAHDIAIVCSSNMSVGVNIVFKLTQVLALAASPEAYAVSMSESHHVHKKDAPSGTAKTLAALIEHNSARTVKNIESIRAGEIIGDHSVTFESGEDVITLQHHAKTRDIFAKGALVAATFLQDKTAGFYTMQDVLGLT